MNATQTVKILGWWDYPTKNSREAHYFTSLHHAAVSACGYWMRGEGAHPCTDISAPHCVMCKANYNYD